MYGIVSLMELIESNRSRVAHCGFEYNLLYWIKYAEYTI